MKKMSCLLLSCLSLLSLAGCGGSDPNAIKIACVKLGYGTDWLTALTREYTKKTGVKFDYTEVVGQAGNNNLNDQLKSLSTSYDIVGCRPDSFHELLYMNKVVAKGQNYDTAFEPLTDIYRETFEGESGNNTIEKKIDKGFLEYVTMNDNYYGIPWASGFVSFVRNLDVWTKFGFTADQYPRTTDELFEMMDYMNTRIAADKATFSTTAPMIYCAADEYYSTVMGTWFAQYEGSEEIEKFYAGRNPQGKRGKDMFTFDGIYETLKVMDKLVNYDKNTGTYTYQHINSKKLSFTQMQNYFLFGDAAFCVNGTWLEVENKYARECNIDYIKVPLISSITDKLSKTYTEAQLREMVTYVDQHPTVGDNANLSHEFEVADIEIIRDSRNTGSYMRTDYDHLFVVPAWSNKTTEAKVFLKWMYSDEALQIFYDTMNGHHLPADPSHGTYNNDVAVLSQFRQSCNEVFEEGYWCNYLINTKKDKIFCVAGVQSNFSNTINKTGNCIDWLVDGMTPEEVIVENTNFMTAKWNSILNAIGQED